MSKIVTTITDPNHPDFGQTTEVDLPDPPTAPRPVERHELIDLLPASVVKAVRDSTDDTVVKQYERFKLKAFITPAEGAALFNFLQGKALMTQNQNNAAVAAWPVA